MLDENSGVYTMDTRVLHGRNGSSFQLAGTVSGQAAFDELVRPTAFV